ncbi:MAG: hypothetical protein LJE84_06210 [Gammaproteobacteria bacterium]|jgi:hypothetical protein|nr:hypothetical protein [Gammaproteobacteria bacterium]
MAKPNYQFDKRRREQAKKKKQDEKRRRKLEKRATSDIEPAPGEDSEASPQTD